MNRISIRLIEERDAQAALDLYKYYVENTIITFEYEPPSLDEYAGRIRINTEKYPWLVCCIGEKMIGFAYGSTHRYRTAYQWSPESTIYLAPDVHTKGIGRILYQSLFAMMRLQGYYNVFAGVSLPNEKSTGFHKAMGFKQIGIFRNVGYKHGAWHDTEWFQLDLQEHTLNPANPKSLRDVIHAEPFIEILNNANLQLSELKL